MLWGVRGWGRRRLPLAMGRKRGPAVMSAANEIAVTAFLEGRIRFDRIFDVVRRTLDLTKSFRASAIEDILEADRLTRLRATALAGKLSCTS